MDVADAYERKVRLITSFYSVSLTPDGTWWQLRYHWAYKAAVDRVHVNDLHATILHLLGIDHTALTYRRNGRDYRLTDVGGRVIRKIIA